MEIINLNILIIEFENKIFEALIELGLKYSKVLEQNQECHFITLNKFINNNSNTYLLNAFRRSPLYKKSALEGVQMWTFILRPEKSGRRISGYSNLSFPQLFDSPLFPLN